MEEQEYLKVSEVAKLLRISRARAYEMVADESIPHVRVGRCIRIRRTELESRLSEWAQGAFVREKQL
jgi:excisionase family DNA binding protein